LRDWRHWGRLNQQLPPNDDPWRSWLILGGRGAGKTRAGAEWIRALALGQWQPAQPQAKRIAIVAPTYQEARRVMIEGQSGLLAVHGHDEKPKYEPSKRQVTWANGSMAQIFSAEDPGGLRGPQFDAAWCDELAKWQYADDTWSNLQFALRTGERPCAIVTTTPRPTALLKRLLADPATAISRSRTVDNQAYLAKSFIEEVMAKYAGTRLGRQELDGELIDDDPDALFKRDVIERNRITVPPDFVRVVVAVDPPASHGKRADACGIICAGLDETGHCYVLEDATVQGLRPAQWAARVAAVYHGRQADRVIAEVNQGGSMVEAVIRQIDETISFKAAYASKGKRLRAEPVAALYEQGKVSHVGSFPDLEDEMCSAIGQGGKSPDRMDALVWAVTELVLRKNYGPRVRVI
jgi:phage terminase large subunit-like protein